MNNTTGLKASNDDTNNDEREERIPEDPCGLPTRRGRSEANMVRTTYAPDAASVAHRERNVFFKSTTAILMMMMKLMLLMRIQ
jgi:hypothetical protein